MSCSCSCKGGLGVVLACSGASNVGQLTNEAANYHYVVVTGLGIEKNRDFDLPKVDVDRVVEECLTKMESSNE